MMGYKNTTVRTAATNQKQQLQQMCQTLFENMPKQPQAWQQIRYILTTTKYSQGFLSWTGWTKAREKPVLRSNANFPATCYIIPIKPDVVGILLSLETMQSAPGCVYLVVELQRRLWLNKPMREQQFLPQLLQVWSLVGVMGEAVAEWVLCCLRIFLSSVLYYTPN